LTTRTRNLRAIVARRRVAFIMAKVLPIQILGPPPDGK
jgi:hypothetical protein